MLRNFEKLLVWQKGCRLSVSVYQALAQCRDFSLKDQMTRAAVSIPSNIAVGAERGGQREFVRFLQIAKGSAAELRTQLCIAECVKALDSPTANQLRSDARKVAAMIQKLIEAENNKQEQKNE